mgnify:FL=1
MLVDIKQLQNIVKPAAQEILIPGFGKHEYSYKADGSVITDSDEAMQQRLISDLQNNWPEFTILGEEMDEAEQNKAMRHEAGYWCIDPLDGTSNYSVGLPFFCVSIALIIDNKQVLGLIYDPIRDECFTAIKGEGAWLNGNRLSSHGIETDPKRVVAEIDMKRLPGELAVRLVTDKPYSSQRNIGSSALDWCWLAADRYNVYLHGGQKLWDYSAGNLLLHEAGGYSISLDGEPVFRAKNETRSALASLDKKLFDHWVEWVGVPG